MAFNVGTAFNQFCGSLRFSDNDLSTIQYRYHSITKRINLDYWGSSSDTANSLYVGSFGRDTEISTSDIDMLIRLPYETYKMLFRNALLFLETFCITRSALIIMTQPLWSYMVFLSQ